MIIVSAVAGLCFLVAIIALAFAYQARRRVHDDEKHLRLLKMLLFKIHLAHNTLIILKLNPTSRMDVTTSYVLCWLGRTRTRELLLIRAKIPARVQKDTEEMLVLCKDALRRAEVGFS